MKITIDSKTGEVKVNGKLLADAPLHHKQIAEFSLRTAYNDNFPLSDYEEDSIWMSYRYCIGRHTIASHMRAGEIWGQCKGRMSEERQLFTAYDINREIETHIGFMEPHFHFPLTSMNRIYTTAVDIVCQFFEDYDIKSIEDLLKYKWVDVILCDNPEGYKLETTTWEEWLRPRVHEFLKETFDNDAMLEDYAWDFFKKWQNKEIISDTINDKFNELTKDMPNPEFYYLNDFEDLFVWNDLAHCLDTEHHHKSILKDGTECEWFWTWTHKTELHDDGYYYRAFGYEKIRVPVNKWTGNITTWLPDESIEKDLY